MKRYAHWLLRVALSSVFLYHGLTKFGNISGFAETSQIPLFLGWLVPLCESGGALLILVGGFSRDIFTRIGGALVIPVMLGAIIKVHWGQWSFLPSESHPVGGIEFQTVLLLIALYFVIVGNERTSADSG